MLLTILAAVAGRDAGAMLTSGAYLDVSAGVAAGAQLLRSFLGGPPNLVLIAETRTGSVDAPIAVESGRELTELLTQTPGVGACTPAAPLRTRRCARPTADQH